MSSRALRKLQKQRELDQLAVEDESAPEADVRESKASSSKFNAFDLLETDVTQEEEDSEKGDTEQQTLIKPESTPVAEPPSGKKKKNKKKKGKKGAATANPNPSEPGTACSNELDDIDRALKELSEKNNSTADHEAATTQTRSLDEEEENTLCSLYSIDSKKLNAINEMKKLFGNVAIEPIDGEGAVQPPGRRRDRNRQALDLGRALAGRFNPASRGQDLSGMALRKNALMQGKDEWPRATSGGLGMEVVSKAASGVTEYKLVHNAAYKDVQNQFYACVHSMQAEQMIQHLQFNPYHISTLLQVSEIAKHQGDHAVSGDLIERALFNIGRSVHSSFGACLKEGKARLDFNINENRELWLAGWRYITNLGMKGTWKTAYEWAKFLLSINADDPYSMCLTIDQLAIKARESDHFIQLCSHPILKCRWELFPNIQCSLALSYFQKGDKDAAKEQLRLAVSRYPWIFRRLAQELNISPVPKSIWGAEAPDKTFEMLSELYLHRAKDIWNTPEVISLLVEVAENTTTKETVKAPEITLDIARHIILSDIPTVTTHLSRNFTGRHISASDPLPPNQSPEDSMNDASWLQSAARRLVGMDRRIDRLADFIEENRDLFGLGRAENTDADLLEEINDRERGIPADMGELARPQGRNHDDLGIEDDAFAELDPEYREVLIDFLTKDGMDELLEFIQTEGVDPGNWQVSRGDTPLSNWVMGLRRLGPDDQRELMTIADDMSASLRPLIEEELHRQREIEEQDDMR